MEGEPRQTLLCHNYIGTIILVMALLVEQVASLDAALVMAYVVMALLVEQVPGLDAALC